MDAAVFGLLTALGNSVESVGLFATLEIMAVFAEEFTEESATETGMFAELPDD